MKHWQRVFLCVLMLAWLAPIVQASDDVVLVLDLETNSVDQRALLAIRETAVVRLVNIGNANPVDLVIRLLDPHTGTVLAFGESFTAVNGFAVGSVDLNTVEAVNHFEGYGHQAQRSVSVAVWDAGRNRLLLNDRVALQNNPYLEGMPLPNPVPPSGLYARMTDLEAYVQDIELGVTTFDTLAGDPAANPALSNFVWQSHQGLYLPYNWLPGWQDITNPPTLFQPTTFAADYPADYLFLTSSIANATPANYESVSNMAATAYGWGDHALAGYLSSVSESDVTQHQAAITINADQINGHLNWWEAPAEGPIDAGGQVATNFAGGAAIGFTRDFPIINTNAAGLRVVHPGAYWIQAAPTANTHYAFRASSFFAGTNWLGIPFSLTAPAFETMHNNEHTIERLALHSEVQVVNETALSMEWDLVFGLQSISSNLWGRSMGPGGMGMNWLLQARSLVGGVATMAPGDYISTPPSTNGVSQIVLTTGSHAANATFEVQQSGDGGVNWATNQTFIAGQGAYGVTVILAHTNSIRLVYKGLSIPAPDQSDQITLSHVRIEGWRLSENVGRINDAAGIIPLVDDAPWGSHPRTIINRRMLDREAGRLERLMANIAPSNVGARLNYNTLDFGTRWQMSEVDENLYTRYIGQDVWWLSNGGTVFPNQTALSVVGTNLLVRVLANAAAEPKPQYTTNLASGVWQWYGGPWTSTWPVIEQGTVTLTIPLPSGGPRFFRAATTTEVSVASAANLRVPLNMHGEDISDVGLLTGWGPGEIDLLTGEISGFTYFGDAAGLTNANASSLFGSGTIPEQYLPPLSINTNEFWQRSDTSFTNVLSIIGQPLGTPRIIDFDSGAIGTFTYSGDASGLTNANASTLFGSGTIPEQYLPPMNVANWSDYASSMNGIKITDGMGGDSTNRLYTWNDNLYYEKQGGGAFHVWTYEHLNPSTYLTVNAFSAAITNYARLVTAPASNTAHGVRGQYAVTPTHLYFYVPGTNRWGRVSLEVDW